MSSESSRRHGDATATDARPRLHDDVEACVDELLERVGPRIRLGIPLGLGKPNQLVNALYRRVVEDPSLELEIFTALSLEPPEVEVALARRLVDPIRQRLYGEWPSLLYARDRRRGRLPANVRVSEFYLSPGQLLGSASAQQSFRLSNYSDAVRDVLDRGLDVVAQMVAKRGSGAETRYSLGSNPDLSLDLIPRLRGGPPRPGDPSVVLAQVNAHMPFMLGDAEVPPHVFDVVVESPDLDFPMFVKPSRPVTSADLAVGLHASALVRDGGTVQLGIGTMSDSVCHMLRLRHRENEAWRATLDASLGDGAETALEIGGTEPFARGLFANTEMLVEGLMTLYREGVLSRSVYPHAGLQRLLDDGVIQGDAVDATLLDALVTHAAVPARPGASDVDALRGIGVLAEDVVLEEGHLRRASDPASEPASESVAADLSSDENRRRIAERMLGSRLRGGHLAQAAFFLGSSHFYRALDELDDEQRSRFGMTRVGWTNTLDGDRALKEAQRRHARFLNETMMVTALGAAVSDGLEDGRVVSGVGGQFDFVVMAQRLAEGRSILMLPSTRDDGTRVTSNVRWNYGHVTIPRQLRDLVVTEYGIADLRGKSDRELVEAHLSIADARFQDELVASAQRARKLPGDYRIPDRWRNNRPERVEELLHPLRERDLCPRFPLGSDLTEVEADLGAALRALRPASGAGAWRLLRLRELGVALRSPEAARPYLERMELDRPRSPGDRLQRILLLWGLARIGVL